jgi:hypothetical protein
MPEWHIRTRSLTGLMVNPLSAVSTFAALSGGVDKVQRHATASR